MKRGFVCLLLVTALLFSCSQVAEVSDTSGTVTDAYTGKTYSSEERLALLGDTALKYPNLFYDPEVKDNYFRILNVVREEYNNPGAVDDKYFAEFEEAKAIIECSYRGDYPVVVISAPEKLGKEYQKGNVTFIDGGESYTGEVQIKVRGNSTSNAPKKPYNIKFDEKVSLFGIEEGKKWSLLANMFDKTLLRNKLSLDFAGKLRLDYTSQSEFCDVWVNGKFMGNYLCCEPVSDGKNRVAVDTAAYDFILEVTPFGGWSFLTGEGVPIYYDSPEKPTGTQKEYLNNLLAAAEKAMKTGDINEYSKYIDVDSFVDFYILKELFKDVDGYWKSLYFYVKDGILYAGPPWDFDLTCGNVSTTYKEDNYYNYHNSNGYGDKSNDSTRGLRMNEGWWKILLATEHFSKLVRERYKELQPLIVNLYEDSKEATNQIDALIEKNSESFAREYAESGTELNAGWNIAESYSIYAGESKGSYEDNVEFLREWLILRNEWLLENIGK